MLVSEILRIKGSTLFTAPPESKVLDAISVMAQHDIGSLVVMYHGRMAGDAEEGGAAAPGRP